MPTFSGRPSNGIERSVTDRPPTMNAAIGTAIPGDASFRKKAIRGIQGRKERNRMSSTVFKQSSHLEVAHGK